MKLPKAYKAEGVKAALALGNRGPMRFGPDGKLTPEILEAYNRTGFYQILLQPYKRLTGKTKPFPPVPGIRA